VLPRATIFTQNASCPFHDSFLGLLSILGPAEGGRT
jgi:hypothetical protein